MNFDVLNNVESPLNTVDSIQVHLKEVRSLIDERQKLGLQRFSAQLQLESLQRDEKQLVEQLKSAYLQENDIAVQVVLEGSPIRNHSVGADFIGNFLIVFQKFLNALGNETQGKKSKRTGKHSKRIVAQNQLFLDALMPTSFGLNFKVAPANQQSSLFDAKKDEGESWRFLPDAVNVLHGFFDGDQPAQDLAEIVGVPLIRVQYEKLMSLLAGQGATLELRTLRHPLPVRLDPSQAAQRKIWIKGIQDDVKRQEITGTLVAAHLRQQTFEILSLEGRKYVGHSTDYATSWLRVIRLGSLVKADLLEIIERHEGTQTGFKTNYILRLIESVEEEDSTTIVERKTQ